MRRARSSISRCIWCTRSKTERHSANTVRPDKERPSCGRYPHWIPLCRDRTVIQRLDASQHFEQGSLSRAVAPHQPHAILRGDEPVQVLKQDFVTKALAGLCELQHPESI